MSGPEPTSLLDIALRRAELDPTTPFLLTIGDAARPQVRTLSYGEVVGRADALSRALNGLGVSAGCRVGCYLSNSPSWVVASLAVWMAGATVAAVGTLVPGPEAEALFDLADVDIVVVLDGAPSLAGRTMVVVGDDGRLVGAADVHRQTVSDGLPDGAAHALAIFTSGTTGQPKGITHSHSDLVVAARRTASAYARTSAYRPDPAPPDRPPGVVFNPFGHMAGYARLAFRMWIGRPTVIVPRFSEAAVRALLERFEMDALQLTPTMIHMLATAEPALDLGAVRYVTSGTAPLSIATRERFETRYGVPVMQAYGMSETGGVSQERYEDVVAGRRGPGSVGRVADGVEVRIRPLEDPDRPAVEGEILVRTDELAKEFLGGAPIPLDGDGWFATGDLGRLEDGILYVTGRLQEKIIVGGFNVYPAEVEDAARRSQLVADAVVVGLPDDRLGERPVAGIVWTGAPAADALIEELRAVLAPYKVPRALFSLDQVPLTARDKVDRRKAAELASSALAAGSAS